MSWTWSPLARVITLGLLVSSSACDSGGSLEPDASPAAEPEPAASGDAGVTGGDGGVVGEGDGGVVGEGDGGVVGEGVSQSCETLDATCAGGDCCEALPVPGGTYPMGRSLDGSDAFADGYADEQPEHDVTIGDFTLDRFEVTVGRMRAFVEQYDGQPPVEGQGALPSGDATGWKTAWNAELPASKDALIAQLADVDLVPYCTWTSAPSGQESTAINCVSWYVAFAFCVWDGGRLPTEAEWEYAAAGGDENRLYPWGAEAPTDTRANYGGADANLTVDVGSRPLGQGRYGHDDLAGSMWEWVYDAWGENFYATGGSGCVDCANTDDTSGRSVYRGGAWTNGPDNLRAAVRNNFLRSNTNTNIGFRCARQTAP